jgi:hypothetical protein
LVYADDLSLLGDNIDIIKKNTRTLIDAGKEVGLEVNTEKTKYIVTCLQVILTPTCRVSVYPRQVIRVDAA